MSEWSGTDWAAFLGGLTAAGAGVAKVAKWIMTTLLAEAHKTIDAKNTEIAELDKRLSRCERDRERLRTAREAS